PAPRLPTDPAAMAVRPPRPGGADHRPAAAGRHQPRRGRPAAGRRHPDRPGDGIMTVRYDSAFIDGRWVPIDGGSSVDLVDPATEEPFATLTLAGPAEADAAVDAARRALDGWSDRAGADGRLGIVRRVRAAIA